MSAITRDQFAILNFGYINGFNLLQYCPEELLLQKYNTFQYLFQEGCNQAYADLKSRLASLYDINSALSNANQTLKNKTGSINISIAALTYISQVYLSQTSGDFPISSVRGIIEIDSTVSIGTTLEGIDLLDNASVGATGFLWFANKYYVNAGYLYLTINGPAVDIKIAASIVPVTVPSPAPTMASLLTASLVKDDLLTEILSKLAIKKILGSSAGTNKQLQSIFDENELMIIEIMEKQRTLNLPEAVMPLSQVPHTISGSFKTIG